MAKKLKNGTDVDFLVWTTNPVKRNKENEVCFLRHNADNEGAEVAVKDVLINGTSNYTITEIIEQKPAAIRRHTFYKVKTKYSSVN